MNRRKVQCRHSFSIGVCAVINLLCVCGALAEGETLEFPQVIPLGASGPVVYDLHATLNQRLANQPIPLPPSFSVTVPAGEKGTYVLTTPRGDLRILNSWTPVWKNEDGENEDIDLTQPSGPIDVIEIKLPAEPIHSVGIYGEQTYALVMLFQLYEQLNPTGEVDAVTLNKLEPLTPSRYPILAAVVRTVTLDETTHEPSLSGSITRTLSALLTTAMLIILAAVGYVIARLVARRVRMTGDRVVARRSLQTQQWHESLSRARVFAKLAHFVPAVMISVAVLFLFPDYGLNDPDKVPPLGIMDWDQYRWWYWAIARLGLAYIVLAGVLIVLALVDAFRIAFNLRSRQNEDGADVPSGEREEETPIAGIVGAAKVMIVGVGVILFCAAVSGVNPMTILGSLSVFTAVILLAFRDTLLGLVASVQIVANDIIKVGDWIEMPKYGANGDVTKINLNMIKVQNFDKTVSTIPTQAVLSESFRNWSSMHEAGGRRIKRSIYIDMNSIKTCDEEMLQSLQHFEFLNNYVATDNGDPKHELTNIGAFREYIATYLESIEDIHSEEGLRHIVRYLQPTEKGLPLEIYAFSNKTAWAPFELVQSEIMEHVLAVLPKFGLKVFQDVGSHAEPARPNC